MDLFTVNADDLTTSPSSSHSTYHETSVPATEGDFTKNFQEFFEPHFNLNSTDIQAYPAGGDFPMTYTSETTPDPAPSAPSATHLSESSVLSEQNEISAFDHDTHFTDSPAHHSTQNPQPLLPSGPNSVTSTDSLMTEHSDDSQHPDPPSKELHAPSKLAPRPVEPISRHRSVLVIGREFDQPNQIAHALERRFGDTFYEHGVFIDSLPVPSHRLLSADPSRFLKRIYSCLLLCYNATEARLLVTADGGYYSSLVPYALSTLGSNKVMLAFTHCQTQENNLLSSDLQTRILSQPHLQPMVNQFRSIFSWSESPSDVHIQRIFEIINESPVFMNSKKACSIL